ncbi:hypothetical protein [Streptomyces sp. NPDC059949]|uniref:hypothetical protein n=1 Tax=Streptomyces sp. NPDC059949 TaxID=3347013 RepID=UPI003661E8AE
MDLQTGVQAYQFVRDRQDDLRDEQHPEGHDAYLQSWRDAHELSQGYATAVQAGNTVEATRVLNALMTMAAPWNNHPDFPAAAHTGHAAHGADPTSEQ